MELWVGPAIIAALVSALVSAAGWFVSSWQAQRLDERRRDEKVHDFQVALRAEIHSDLLNMVVADRAEFLDEIAARYRSDMNYSVVVAHLARNMVFESIVGQIHVLPGDVIAPVIHYARLRQTIERFIDDLRANSFSQLSAERQLTMYSDYLEMTGRLEALAQNAIAAIDLSLNNQDAGQSNPVSASGPDGASAERKASP